MSDEQIELQEEWVRMVQRQMLILAFLEVIRMNLYFPIWNPTFRLDAVTTTLTERDIPFVMDAFYSLN